jgi:hypothetical protein
MAASSLPPTQDQIAPSALDLRPLSTSQLIDRGFALYRSNFTGLFLLALLCQIIPLATSEALLAGTRLLPSGGSLLERPNPDLAHAGIVLAIWVLCQLITFCFEVVLTLYLSDAYLGRVPSIKAGLLRLRGLVGASIKTSLLNILLITLTLIFPFLAFAAIYLVGLLHPPQGFGALIVLLALALVLLVASVVPLLIVFMRLMVTVPAVTLEGLSGWQAVKRSSALVRYDPGLGFMYWGEMRLSFLLLPLFVIELLALFPPSDQ